MKNMSELMVDLAYSAVLFNSKTAAEEVITLENEVNKRVKERGKFRYFMSRIFPPYRFYKTAYPWAYKSVILIPIAWLMRLFRIIFKNPKRAANELKAIAKSDAKEEKEK